MNNQDQMAYLGRVISLLARHEQLTLGEIKNKTRAFLRKRHQTDSSLFNLLRQFVEEGKLKQTVHQSRIKYAIADELRYKALEVEQSDLIETGLDKNAPPDELIIKLANIALKSRGKAPLPTKQEINKETEELRSKQYVPKAPPPSSVDGFK